MIRIGLLSDTHGVWDDSLISFFSNCDEIWHAGDIGSLELADKIAAYKPLRAVYGNIDDSKVHIVYPKYQYFKVEGVNVLITHIGGTPNNNDPIARSLIDQFPPNLFICGHSHILKVKFDKKENFMYMNPGAAGNFGPHRVRTAVRFVVDGANISDLEIWEKKKSTPAL